MCEISHVTKVRMVGKAEIQKTLLCGETNLSLDRVVETIATYIRYISTYRISHHQSPEGKKLIERQGQRSVISDDGKIEPLSIRQTSEPLFLFLG